MRRTSLLFLLLAASVLPGHAQRKGHRSGSVRGKQEAITVTGCVREGVECMVLEPLGSRQKYSVNRDRRLRPGRAYRITGATSDMGFCMQGLPILSPQKVTALRTRCPRSKRGQ